MTSKESIDPFIYNTTSKEQSDTPDEEWISPGSVYNHDFLDSNSWRGVTRALAFGEQLTDSQLDVAEDALENIRASQTEGEQNA